MHRLTHGEAGASGKPSFSNRAAGWHRAWTSKSWRIVTTVDMAVVSSLTEE
jgi:hypothetical protein